MGIKSHTRKLFSRLILAWQYIEAAVWCSMKRVFSLESPGQLFTSEFCTNSENTFFVEDL